MAITCVASTKGVGGTFVDWSLHYLSGSCDLLSWTHKKVIPLTSNPLTVLNAHGHQKNHPTGLSQAQECIRFLKNFTQNSSFYAYCLNLDSACIKARVSIAELNNTTAFSKVVKIVEEDFNEMLKFIQDSDINIIFINANNQIPLYYNITRSLDRSVFADTKPMSAEEVKEEVDTVFFSKDRAVWSADGLTHIWDIRERKALNYRPFQPVNYTIDLSVDHCWVDCMELWTDGLNIIPDLVSQVGLTVNISRLEQWKEVCTMWQQKQTQALKFQWTYQHIVDAIVNNWDYPIDLTFDEEIIIQHCLIYQHNLNLKTWNLAKFPNNTKDLHQLLEPNIHKLK